MVQRVDGNLFPAVHRNSVGYGPSIPQTKYIDCCLRNVTFNRSVIVSVHEKDSTAFHAHRLAEFGSPVVRDRFPLQPLA